MKPQYTVEFWNPGEWRRIDNFYKSFFLFFFFLNHSQRCERICWCQRSRFPQIKEGEVIVNHPCSQHLYSVLAGISLIIPLSDPFSLSPLVYLEKKKTSQYGKFLILLLDFLGGMLSAVVLFIHPTVMCNCKKGLRKSGIGWLRGHPQFITRIHIHTHTHSFPDCNAQTLFALFAIIHNPHAQTLIHSCLQHERCGNTHLQVPNHTLLWQNREG